MIVVDSREKKWEHIREYFDKHEIPYEFPHKLDEGDYVNTDNPNVVIDRKANLQEICGNLQVGNGNIVRFTKECRRAYQRHKRFVVLIEGTNVRNVNDLKGWQSKYSKHTGSWLVKKMFELTVTYDVEWVFCKKNETAEKILQITGYANGKTNNVCVQDKEQKDGAENDDVGGFTQKGD